MKRLVVILLLFFSLSLSKGFLFPLHVQAAPTTPTQETFLKAQVVQVVSESTLISDGGSATRTQTLKLQIQDAPEQGKVITIDQGNDARIAAFHTYHVGDTVIVDQTTSPDRSVHYTITDTYRIPNLFYLFLGFALFAIAVAGRKGLGALVGLGISLGIIIVYIIPQMLAGQDPLTVSMIGAFIILFVTTFLAHGFSKQTAVAVASTFLALLATYCLSLVFVSVAHIFGLGTEDSYLLELTPGLSINPQGLLLGGIIIGTLGALNDITTTQVASMVALYKANRQQTCIQLLEHGFGIGKEHIASLINTLVLAYAGTSLPIFIFALMNPQHVPLWVMINNEEISQEIIRSITASSGLILAVPIATLLGAWLAPRLVTTK